MRYLWSSERASAKLYLITMGLIRFWRDKQCQLRKLSPLFCLIRPVVKRQISAILGLAPSTRSPRQHSASARIFLFLPTPTTCSYKINYRHIKRESSVTYIECHTWQRYLPVSCTSFSASLSLKDRSPLLPFFVLHLQTHLHSFGGSSLLFFSHIHS